MVKEGQHEPPVCPQLPRFPQDRGTGLADRLPGPPVDPRRGPRAERPGDRGKQCPFGAPLHPQRVPRQSARSNPPPQAAEGLYRAIYSLEGAYPAFPEHYPTSALLGCVEVVGCLSRQQLDEWASLPPSVKMEGKRRRMCVGFAPAAAAAGCRCLCCCPHGPFPPPGTGIEVLGLSSTPLLALTRSRRCIWIPVRAAAAAGSTAADARQAQALGPANKGGRVGHPGDRGWGRAGWRVHCAGAEGLASMALTAPAALFLGTGSAAFQGRPVLCLPPAPPRDLLLLLLLAAAAAAAPAAGQGPIRCRRAPSGSGRWRSRKLSRGSAGGGEGGGPPRPGAAAAQPAEAAQGRWTSGPPQCDGSSPLAGL